MSTDVTLVENEKNTKRRSWRALSFFVAISLAVVGSLVFGNSETEASVKNDNSKISSASSGFKSTNNWPSVSASDVAPNPAPTFGPNCVGRVAVLIDRSHSVINIAQSNGVGDYAYVNEMKFALGSVINQLGQGAQNSGNEMYLIPIAFAGSAVVQTPYTGSTLGEFYSFVSSMDVSNPANRARLGSEIGVNENGIYYRDSTLDGRYKGPDYNPNLMFGGTINGFPDSWLNLRGYAAGDNGTTNWQAAFDAARGQVGFWTPGAPSDGDDDFDLVLMITDGIPTSHDANMSGPWSNPDAGDLKAAQDSINALRLGAFGTIPQTPVHGLVVGSDAQRSDISEIMNKTFGAGSYTLESNWSNLRGKLNEIIANYSCIPKVEVKTGIEVTATPVPSTVREGQEGTISITVRNTSDVPLTGVSVRINPSGVNDIVVPMFSLLPAGQSRTFTHTYRTSVPLGMPAPAAYSAEAHAWAVLGPNETLAPGNSLQPVNSIPFGITIERIPLPT